MSRINCATVRLGTRRALSVALLGLIVFLPASALAGGDIVMVPPPNGVDDTANIQAALNACVVKGPNCTVQLSAGHYFTKQVVEYNFYGTFRGAGTDITTIEALPNLPVSLIIPGGTGQCVPNTSTCLWPSLIMFVEGNIGVSDLTIKASAVPATQPWPILGGTVTMLLEVLGFRGKYPMNVSIDRVHMEGQTDNYPTDWGFNVMNGAHFTGELPRGSVLHDYYFLSGSFTVRNSYFKSFIAGISQDGFVRSSRVTIGGSPSAGNHFENNYVGTDIESSENSVFELSFNESTSVSDSGAAMWVVPWDPAVFVPSSPSRYMIHDNKCYTTGQYAEGILLLDDPTNPWIHAAVWNNTVELQNSQSEGIGVYNTKGTAIWNNSVAGSGGYDAIGLWNTRHDTVINNNVSGFTVDSTGYAQIYLDPSTTHDLVVCAERSDTVLNQGTNNIIIGCLDPAATPASVTESAAPFASTPNRVPPRGKPRLF